MVECTLEIGDDFTKKFDFVFFCPPLSPASRYPKCIRRRFDSQNYARFDVFFFPHFFIIYEWFELRSYLFSVSAPVLFVKPRGIKWKNDFSLRCTYIVPRRRRNERKRLLVPTSANFMIKNNEFYWFANFDFELNAIEFPATKCVQNTPY